MARTLKKRPRRARAGRKTRAAGQNLRPNLRQIKSPIIVFCSWGDDITPPQQALDFAAVLPAIPRALFVQDWTLAEPQPWADRAAILAEVKALRRHHNFAPDSAIEAVSCAVHRVVRPDLLRCALQRIGPEALAFWALQSHSPEALAPSPGEV